MVFSLQCVLIMILKQKVREGGRITYSMNTCINIDPQISCKSRTHLDHLIKNALMSVGQTHGVDYRI